MLVNAGKDLIYTNMVSLSQAAAANYMAVTANNTSPSAGDTTLAGEITTASGGLVRAQATPAHTNGTSTITLTRTFTANGSDSLPVVLAKMGTFNATPSGGSMMLETLLSATATITTSGDACTITDTITLT